MSQMHPNLGLSEDDYPFTANHGLSMFYFNVDCRQPFLH